MDFDFTDDQVSLRDAVARWVEKGFPFERRLALARAGGRTRAIWGELAELGLAGLAVPDWPTTYGYNMFFFPISQWTGGIFHEHVHRLVASLLGLWTIVLAVGLQWGAARRWVRALGWLALE